MPTHLHLRLLYLCHLSYALRTGYSIPPVTPRPGNGFRQRDALIGATAPHLIIEGYLDAQSGLPRDVAIVTNFHEAVVICFRGTVPPTLASLGEAEQSLKDWVNDGAIALRSIDGISGKVHHGFAAALDTVWLKLVAAVNARLSAAGAPQKVIITGHSKGGAVANLAAMRLRGAFPGCAIEVVTFAAARSGDQAFAVGYAASGVHCIRYEVRMDVVPDVPLGTSSSALARLVSAGLGLPASIGYVAIGEARKDTYADNSLANAVFQGGAGLFDAIRNRTQWSPLLAKAHDIGPGSDYDKLVHHHVD